MIRIYDVNKCKHIASKRYCHTSASPVANKQTHMVICCGDLLFIYFILQGTHHACVHCSRSIWDYTLNCQPNYKLQKSGANKNINLHTVASLWLENVTKQIHQAPPFMGNTVLWYTIRNDKIVTEWNQQRGICSK